MIPDVLDPSVDANRAHPSGLLFFLVTTALQHRKPRILLEPRVGERKAALEKHRILVGRDSVGVDAIAAQSQS
jgi:hypothetical protein